jgi:isocitrate lyase
MSYRLEQIVKSKDPGRWNGIRRDYAIEDVLRLRCPQKDALDVSLACSGSERFWDGLRRKTVTTALGALTGLQAVQYVDAGQEAVYCSGWQVAADANLNGETFPDQSLYAAPSAPVLVRRINNAFRRAAEIDRSEGRKGRDWFVPVIADAEAGFGGPLNAYELMKAMIAAGAAAVHYEDQLASAKKCGHMGGKVLVPTQEFIRTLTAARLAADVMGVPTVLIGRTDANSAKLITSDVDERDRPFLTGRRTPEGFHELRGGLDAAIARGTAYAPYADLLWCETSTPDLDEARRFAEAIHGKHPGKLLAYNCSPSFNWRKNFDRKYGKDADAMLGKFRDELAQMGYKYQFITLAGFHALNLASFELAKGFTEEGMPAYVRLQQREFAAEKDGYRATEHQRFVGTGYFDKVSEVISGGNSSTLAMHGSTADQFGTQPEKAAPADHASEPEMPMNGTCPAPFLDTRSPHRHEDEIR